MRQGSKRVSLLRFLTLGFILFSSISLVNAATNIYHSSDLVLNYGTIQSGTHMDLHASDDTRIVISSTRVVSTSHSEYQPRSYTNLGSTKNDASVIGNLQTSNEVYITFYSYGSATSTSAYNPSGYKLLGLTTLENGSVLDLISDDSIYMVFKSNFTGSAEESINPIQNMNFTTDLGHWTTDYTFWENVGSPLSGAGSVAYNVTGRNVAGAAYCQQDFRVDAIPSSAVLNFYWKKYYGAVTPAKHEIYVELIYGGEVKYSWSDTTRGTVDWTWVSINVTGYIDAAGTWALKLRWDLKDGNSFSAWTQASFDDVGIELKTARIGQQTCMVEFTGSSNTYEWAQLAWAVDACWAIESVSVVIQLYNYNASQYPTSGDGYLSYTSDAVANTDEIKTQKITVIPQQFRDANGNWKIRIIGVKDTVTHFDLKVDWIKLEPTYYSEYTTDWYMIFTSVDPTNAVKFSFTYEGQVDADSVAQKLYVYDFTNTLWVLCDTSMPQLRTDETITFEMTQDLSKYVSDEEVRLRIEQTKTTASSFSCLVDYGHLQTKVDSLTYRTEWYGHCSLTASEAGGATELNMTYEGQYSVLTDQEILVFNWTSGQWDSKDMYTIGTTDVKRSFLIFAGLNHYINSGNYSLRMKVKGANNPETPYDCLGDLWQVIVTYTVPSFPGFGLMLGIIGGLVTISIVIGGVVFFNRRRRGKAPPFIHAGEGDHEDAFSKTLGLSHRQLVSRKILFEFDPASNYEKAIQDFAIEASANDEPTTIFTRKGSAIHLALGERTIKFFCLTSEVSVPKEGASENEMLLPMNNTPLMINALNNALEAHPNGVTCVVFDILSDLILSIGFEEAYSFVRYVTGMLAPLKVTVLFLLNSSAHDLKVASSLRGLFSNQLAYGKEGIRLVRLSEVGEKYSINSNPS